MTIWHDIDITGDVTIPAGKTLTIKDGVNVRFADGKKLVVYGTLNAASGAKFTKAAGGTYWSGIEIKSTGVLSVSGPITIEYATAGIQIENTNGISNGSNKITIQNCNQAGIGVNNCSPTIHHIYMVNVSNSTYQNGGVTVTGSSANPVIDHCTVKGNNTDSGTYYGVMIGTSSTGTDMNDSDIQNSVYSHSIQVNTSCLINLNEAAPGNNIVRRNSGVKAVNNPSSGSIDARYNWWGVNPPTDDLFAYPAYVDYSLYSTSPVPGSGASKPVLQEIPDNLNLARSYERKGDFSEALRLYAVAVTDEKDPCKRNYAVSAMMRCIDKHDRNYSVLRDVLKKQLSEKNSDFIEPLDFIESDIFVREGRYREAVDSFRSKLERYKGTYMEAEMLIRIAQMYGDYLNDKATAKEYADRAASVNPGQETLRFAYAAAGIQYNPIQHENRFALDYSSKPEPQPVEQKIGEFVTISPNPANPITTITYSIRNPSNVRLSIYSVNGQKIATLVNGHMSAGTHSASFDGSNHASGVYFYRLESAGLNKSGKILLLK